MNAEVIEGARVIVDDRIEVASVRIEAGRITGLDVARDGAAIVPGKGRLLAPAFVDIHGDAFERQIMPRPGVVVPMDVALLETDRQLAANAIRNRGTGLRAVVLGGERKFAAGANWIGQLIESGHSGLRPSVFDLQVQRTAAVSPNCSMLQVARRTAFEP
jgi:alpha-D-ribose 1-methylphosphonate 5-triphosphate diphosphatase